MVAGYLQLLNNTDPRTRRFSRAVLCNEDCIKFSICNSRSFASQLCNPLRFQTFSSHLYYIICSHWYGLCRWCIVLTFACLCVMVGPLLVLKLIYNGEAILPYEFKRNNYYGTICRYTWGIISAHLHKFLTIFCK